MVSLEELNAGTVQEKFYLHPVCGSITCDTIFANNLPPTFNQALNTFNTVQFAGITNLRTTDSRIILGSNSGPTAGSNTVSIGSNSNAGGQDAVSIGLSSSAGGGSGIAIGNTAVASALGSIAIGVNSLSSAKSLAVGREARATNDASIVINANDGTQLQSTASNQIRMKAGTTDFTYDATGFSITNTTASTSTTTGALKVSGGVGIAGNLNFAGTINGTTNGGGQFAQTQTITVANSIVETSLMGTGVGTLTVPANSFPVGGSYVVEGGGVMSCLNNAILDIRIYGGPSGLTLLGAIPQLTIPASTGKWWGIALYFTVRTIGGVGVASLSARAVYTQNENAGNNLFGQSFHVINQTTFDTTVDNTLRITAQWAVASASNTIAMAQLVLTKMY